MAIQNLSQSYSKGEEGPLLEKSISPLSFDGEPQVLFAVGLILIGFLTIILLERIGKKS